MFEHAPEDCSLQKFMADRAARLLIRPDQVDMWNKRTTSTMVAAVLKAMVVKRYGDTWPTKWEAAKYLEHKTEQASGKTEDAGTMGGQAG
jgi:hypothetical protein